MKDFYCQAQFQQSPISNCAELGPTQPQLVKLVGKKKNVSDLRHIVLFLSAVSCTEKANSKMTMNCE